MKKRTIIVCIFISILLINVVSAFSLIDFLNKITGRAASGSSCYDTDGGVDYYVKGSAIKEGGLALQDSCGKDGINLAEAFCNDKGNPSFKLYSCPYGCVEGACIGQEEISTGDIDTDGATCNYNGVCEPNEDESCDDCQIISDSCRLTNAYWSKNLVQEGVNVKLIIEGINCDGEKVIFDIREDEIVSYTPITSIQNFEFSAGKAEAEWIAQYLGDGFLQGNPEYYFKAYLESDNTLYKNSNKLMVIQKSQDQTNKIRLNKNFNKNSEYLLTYPEISHLSLDGNINLNKDSSFVRVVLKDEDDREYLIFEANALLYDKTYKFSGECEETCDMKATNIKSLIIELSDASIKIEYINFEEGISIEDRVIVENRRRKLKNEKENEKINKLKAKIKAKKLNWTAGETSISKLTYEEKKNLFDLPGLDGKLPNLRGFEYYKGGVFELSSDLSSGFITGNVILVNPTALPESWDWRNVHGENWLTSVKHQGTAPTCQTFASLGALESQINLYYNQHLDVDLSEQMMVDCRSTIAPIIELRVSPHPIYFCEEGIDISPAYGLVFPGKQYCEMLRRGVVNELCAPYANRGFYASSCNYNNICNNFNDSMWKISDFEDYIYAAADYTYGVSDLNDLDYSRLTILPNEEEIKRLLVERGPVDSGISSWGHALALIGYETDQNTGETIWIFKNSWGADWGEAGYVRMKVPLADLTGFSLPLGPFISSNRSYWPKDFDGEIKCVDKDNDNYCNWGISKEKPITCPDFCNPEKDFDDSNSFINFGEVVGCSVGGGNTVIQSYDCFGWDKHLWHPRVLCSLSLKEGGDYVVSCGDGYIAVQGTVSGCSGETWTGNIGEIADGESKELCSVWAKWSPHLITVKLERIGNKLKLLYYGVDSFEHSRYRCKPGTAHGWHECEVELI